MYLKAFLVCSNFSHHAWVWKWVKFKLNQLHVFKTIYIMIKNVCVLSFKISIEFCFVFTDTMFLNFLHVFTIGSLSPSTSHLHSTRMPNLSQTCVRSPVLCLARETVPHLHQFKEWFLNTCFLIHQLCIAIVWETLREWHAPD